MDLIKDNAPIIQQKIDAAANILIATHLNPDGDAVGSGLALLNIFKNAGKNCKMVLPNEAPAFLNWMKGAGEILVHTKNPKRVSEAVKEADLIFFVDFNDLQRLGDSAPLFEEASAFRVLIDHHPGPGNFSDIIISLPEIGSASEIIMELLREMDFLRYLDRETAECLYTGIMTDTGNFSFACSYPGVWLNVARLIEYKIDRDRVYSLVYDNYKEKRMRLMGFCLHQKMIILEEYNTAIISLSAAEMKEFKYEPGDTEGFVNLPFSVKGIKLSVLMLEKKDYIKLSLRSRGDFSVNDFARKFFSGGGHRNAAGGELPGSLDSAIEFFISSLENYRSELS